MIISPAFRQSARIYMIRTQDRLIFGIVLVVAFFSLIALSKVEANEVLPIMSMIVGHFFGSAKSDIRQRRDDPE